MPWWMIADILYGLMSAMFGLFVWLGPYNFQGKRLETSIVMALSWPLAVAFLALALLVYPLARVFHLDDWPQWTGRPTRPQA